MKLSKQTSDAVSILIHCKQSDGELVKVGRIAEDLNLTKQMALKLSNRLSRAELLTTVRGPKGGVQLTELAEGLTLGKIVRRLEAVLYGTEGGTHDNPFDLYFDEAFEAFLEVLDQHTLEDLAANKCRTAKSKAAVSRKRKAKAIRTKSPRAKTRGASIAPATRRSKTDRRDRA